jgi:hypothetical protein
LTVPAPKNDVLPVLPVHCLGSSAGQSAGHGVDVADDRRSAATPPDGMFGYFERMSAATPAACGEAMDVPLIHTYRPPPLTTARLAATNASQLPEASVLDQPARMRPRPKTDVGV